ncbi:MAG: hypothetical protein JXI32_08320 [Deltaproteobacteria bacterium]|nr:hypothetical protein [Deltaproteobacteria bacterium]
MSIVQDFYTIYDRESGKYRDQRSSTNRVVLELSRNLSFLREGLAENLDSAAIVAGLEDEQFRKASEKGTNLNAIQKRTLDRDTYGDAKEFEKYRGWSTEKLINNAYERVATIRKLGAGSRTIDMTSRLQYLFKYLMVLIAHLEGRRLEITSGR